MTDQSLNRLLMVEPEVYWVSFSADCHFVMFLAVAVLVAVAVVVAPAAVAGAEVAAGAADVAVSIVFYGYLLC